MAKVMNAESFLLRVSDETRGMTMDELVPYLSQHVGVGLAFMRGALGEKWTREFVTAAFLAIDAHGSETFVSPSGQRVTIPRDPSGN